jgi:ADP-ribose pyrophosphatase YjhB (NUDIX family)
MAEKPVHRAVSAACRRVDGMVLAVKRPDEPGEELPGVWGLPAIRLLYGESAEDGVRRLGPAKLGIELTPIHPLAEGTQGRDEYTLHMTVFEATPGTEPALPHRQPGADMTLYDEADWLPPEALNEAAERGSLCCKLFLEAIGPDTSKPLTGPPDEPLRGPPEELQHPEEE